MDDVGERRVQQAELYGDPLDQLTDQFQRDLGLSAADVAATIGVSLPMFDQVLQGLRVRLGNPAAIARLAMLRDLAGHVATGAASAADVPLGVAQIRASAGVPLSDPTAFAGRAATSGTTLLTMSRLLAARESVGRHLRPTATLAWPMLDAETGVTTYVKHENHNPTGAFKVRGGLVLVERLLASRPGLLGLVSATRGNHGQSLAYAGRVHGLPVTIVVPEGNSPDKNAAMRAYGAELVVHGRDYQEAREHAGRLAEERGLEPVPPFHPFLVEGVATYAAEIHESVPDVDAIYVPVGMGSGICANIAVRDLLGKDTEIVGVVSDRAPAYKLSHEAGRPVSTETADTFVDGVACRVPDADAVAIIAAGVTRMVEVSDAAVEQAMALHYRATHNLPEPAGAIALAGLLADAGAERARARKVVVVQSGGNCDFDLLARAFR